MASWSMQLVQLVALAGSSADAAANALVTNSFTSGVVAGGEDGRMGGVMTHPVATTGEVMGGKGTVVEVTVCACRHHAVVA